MRIAGGAMLVCLAAGAAGLRRLPAVAGEQADGRAAAQRAGQAAGLGSAKDETLPDTVTFAFVPRDTQVAPWEITTSVDGSGKYWEQGSEAAPQQLHVSEVTWRRLTGGNETVLAGRCESRQKVAQTGAKTVTVRRNGAAGECTFNYSDDAALNEAVSAFLGLAETLHLGAKLQRDHRFDKLALDADADALEAAVKDGRALEVENIAPVLLAMVEDDRVIDRARRKAARLLQAAGVPVPPEAPVAVPPDEASAR